MDLKNKEANVLFYKGLKIFFEKIE